MVAMAMVVVEAVLIFCLAASSHAARQFVSSSDNFLGETQSTEKVAALSDVESKSTFICAECLKLSKRAEEVLSNPDTPTQAKEFIAQHVCNTFPGDGEKKCEEMLDAYVPVALATLQEYMAPEKMCTGSGLCASNLKSIFVNPQNCAICQYVVTELKIKLRDPKTQEKLIEILLDGCLRVPNHVDQCQTAVLEYVPLLLAHLKTVLDPTVLCAKIGACPATQLPSLGLVQSS